MSEIETLRDESSLEKKKKSKKVHSPDQLPALLGAFVLCLLLAFGIWLMVTNAGVDVGALVSASPSPLSTPEAILQASPSP